MTTISGFLLPDGALACVDSEIWCKGKVLDYQPKLAVNPLLCAVGSGTGLARLVNAGDAVVRAAVDFDDCVEKVAKALRNAVVKHTAAGNFKTEDLSVSYFVAGYSPAAGRVLCWSMRFEHFFLPMLETAFLAPEVELPHDAWKPQNQADALMIARKQMAKLRETLPSAGESGALCIAHLRPGAMSIVTIPDFDAAPSRITQEELTA